MNKYKSGVGLAKQINQERQFDQKQKSLRQKHEVKDENVIVVEKPSLAKFLLSTAIAIIKTMVLICVLILATLGMITLIYPEPRNELVRVLVVIVWDCRSMLGI